MNQSKTKGLTNLNSDGKLLGKRVSLVRMYFSQFAAISCYLRNVDDERHVGDGRVFPSAALN